MKGFTRAVFAALSGLVIASILASCERVERPEEPNLGTTVQEIAFRAQPGLRGQNLRFTGNVLDGGDGVCACIQVCDANGENCTACVCDPTGCGTCD